MKRFLVYLILGIILFGCGGKHEVPISIPQKMDQKQAISILEQYISKQFNEKGYYYYKTIQNLKQGRIAFVWKNDQLGKYFVRYYIVSGKDRYVELLDKGGEYQISVKKGDVIVNCYGYTYKLPNVYDRNMKINFEVFSQNDCRNAIRFTLKDKKDAEELAAALMTLFSVPEDNEDAEVLDQMEKADKKDSTKQYGTKCSVDKILKMKEIGLTNDEIKKICE
ncbi:hypothetical protein [Calditerrivibrio sp.]|jgi:hypothetical protein|uniref:hypothetical protein n=1 Tax=Calditerrivibrio sp. TaxID=2792612 RepID=UPI003D0D32BA